MLKQIEGSRAMAEGIAFCRPEVICAYPITPQTHIVEGLGEMVRAGELKNCEFINVESEFAALSVAIGASAAGARAYTATASQGLLFMAEAGYNASGLGLAYQPFMVAGRWKGVSSRVDLRLESVYSRGSEQNPTTPCSAPLFVGATAVGTNCDGLSTTGTPATLVDPALVNGGQFPKETNTFQRFNVIGRYYVEPTVVPPMGFKGGVTVKVRSPREKKEKSKRAIRKTTPHL